MGFWVILNQYHSWFFKNSYKVNVPILLKYDICQANNI